MLLNNGKYQKRQLVHLVSTETYYKAYSMDVQTQAQSAVQTIRIRRIHFKKPDVHVPARGQHSPGLKIWRKSGNVQNQIPCKLLSQTSSNLVCQVVYVHGGHKICKFNTNHPSSYRDTRCWKQQLSGSCK